jgi:dipeptidyl aminopeptidase/acylaminoacyl peptidase
VVLNKRCQVRNVQNTAVERGGLVSGPTCQQLLGFAALAIFAFLSACSSGTPQPSATIETEDSLAPSPHPVTPIPTPSSTSPPFTPTPTAQPTLVLTPSTSTGFPTDFPGWIAYTAILDPGPSVRIDIARLTADRGDQVWLTETDNDSLIGVFSMDGEHIAFWSFDLQTQISNLWVKDLEDGISKPLTTEGVFVMKPVSWSPDGSFIVFEDTRSEDRATDVFRVGVYDGNLVNLTGQSLFIDGAPVWSPDGRWIAFHSNREGQEAGTEDIWRMSRDGTDLKNLTAKTYPWRDRLPAWSPDGSRIAFYRQGRPADSISSAGLPGLWVMNADGTNQQLLMPFDNFPDEPPEWSPDGSWIASSDGVPEVSDIWLAPSQGGKAVPIPIPGLERSICWSPDSTALMFTHDDGDNLSLMLVKLETLEILPIALDGWGDYCDWTP